MSKLTDSRPGNSFSKLKVKGGTHTALEINQQPELWGKTTDKFFKESESIHAFINSAVKEADQIIFTGAGTSSFIGQSLKGIFFEKFNIHTGVVPTTEIVSFPGNYFNRYHSSLIISFARSGESPESVAALKLADQFGDKCFHLIITCDGSGALANYHSGNPVKVFILPPEANDKSLAMTGSYSSMLLAGLLFSYSENFLSDDLRIQLELSRKAGKKILTGGIELLKEISAKDFKRAVFLGSGPLFGTALEASLKLQELTGGKIICKADTFLGFRHGPKAVVNEETLIVYFFSNNLYVRQYEMDLLNSMRKGTRPLIQLGICDLPVSSDQLDYYINLDTKEQLLNEFFQPLSFILPAQLLGFFKSLNLGLSPDNPSPEGAISRVVQGVTIYPVDRVAGVH